MKKLQFGIIAGVLFGIIDLLFIIPLDIPNKTTVMAITFAARFLNGLLIPILPIKLPYWLRGILIGVVISIPGIFVAQSLIPLVVGVVGSFLIGLIAQKVLKK